MGRLSWCDGPQKPEKKHPFEKVLERTQQLHSAACGTVVSMSGTAAAVCPMRDLNSLLAPPHCTKVTDDALGGGFVHGAVETNGRPDVPIDKLSEVMTAQN